MSKRDHSKVNGAGEVVGSRHKRRREAGGSSSDVDITMSDPIVPEHEEGGGSGVVDPTQVKEQGLKLLQAVKDAVKDGRQLCLIFLRKPSKRQYPDYYQLIKEPIALDDIKKSIETGAYSTLEEAKNAVELCFTNAKQYNLKDSVIWQDAKDLLKIVNKAYSKMMPHDEDGEKHKTPNLNRLIKARLEKLAVKVDSTGRTLSDEFMELPSRKEWPIYYTTIKKPQCIDNIFKRIKRKEYAAAPDFAADVELVFSNAMAFNQEHTPIWEDALALRDYFRQLMSDMPPPHSMPEYSKPSNKIKIRPPQAAQPTASASTSQAPKAEPANSSSLLLRVPAHNGTPKPMPQASTSHSGAISRPPPIPAPSKTLLAAPAVTQAQIKAPTPQPALQNISFVNATPSHYPNISYQPPPASAPSVSATPPVLQASSVVNTNSASHSPAPVVFPPSHQLKSINLRTHPQGRRLDLDHRDGVKSWALRLMPGETTLIVSDVTFVGDEEGEESSGDEEAEVEKHEEEDDDMEVDVEGGVVAATKNGKKKGKGRGRGRPPKASIMAAKAAAAKVAKAKKKASSTSKIGDVQLKLNGFAVMEQADQHGEWNVNVPVGSNTIEIGESGGMIWKVYLQRVGDA